MRKQNYELIYFLKTNYILTDMNVKFQSMVASVRTSKRKQFTHHVVLTLDLREN